MTLKEQYKTVVVPKLKEAFHHENVLSVPTIKKVTINIGLSKGIKDAKYLDVAERTIKRISGQQPVKTLARKSISTFKIRQGMVVGMMTTLRGKRMWDFLDKLVHVTFPRVRDFRGLSEKSFDAAGNFSVGFSEHTAFPEIGADEIENIHGLQVTINTNAPSRNEGMALLKELGFPFKKEESKKQ